MNCAIFSGLCTQKDRSDKVLPYGRLRPMHLPSSPLGHLSGGEDGLIIVEKSWIMGWMMQGFKENDVLLCQRLNSHENLFFISYEHEENLLCRDFSHDVCCGFQCCG